MENIKTIAFDADDTLWVNEPIFTEAQEKFKEIIKNSAPTQVLDETLYQTEVKNLKHFGYGVKGFTLSMIETAIELSEGKVSGAEIQKIIELGKYMIAHPVHLLPNVKETIKNLKADYQLMIITKGDLFDQESKVARSGIADYFDRVEIVSEKNEANYKSVFERNDINIKELLMIGNSLKSDVLPVCKMGGYAIHIPFHTTWAHEIVETHQADDVVYQELADISLLPAYLNQFS